MNNRGQSNTLKGLFILCLPSILAGVLEPLASVIDTALIGHLDKSSLAALAVAATIVNSFAWIFNFLVHAGAQSMSEAYSLNSQKAEYVVMKVTTILSLALGLIFGLVLIFFRHRFYALSGASVNLYPLIDEYFLVRVAGLPLALLYPTIISLIRGKGGFKSSFALLLMSTSLNIGLSFWFLHGLHWGLSGVALGTVLSSLAGTVWGYVVLFFTGNSPGQSILAEIKKLMVVETGWHHWRIFGQKGRDLFVRSGCLTLSFFLSTRITTLAGEADVGAHQVMLQLWLFSSFFIDGVAVTANVKTAELMTRGNRRDLGLLFRNSYLIAVFFGVLFTMFYLVAEGPLIAVFTGDPDVRSMVASHWWLIWMFQVVNALAFVIDGILFGSGSFRWLRNMMVTGFLFCYLPAAYSGLSGSSLTNVWVGLVILNFYRLVLGSLKVHNLLQPGELRDR